MNDFNRLLDDAVPEPRRALAAGDLVRRARRRHATRTAALGAVTAVALVAGVAVANGATSGSDRPPLATTVSPEPSGKPVVTSSATPTQVRWPDDAGWGRVRCTTTYPAGLADMRVAFAGTVTDVRVGPIPKEGPTPVEIDFAVERAYGRAFGGTVTLHTTYEMLPLRDYGITGTRVLAATDPADEPSAGTRLTLRPCGFTRTYRPEDAAFWERVFEPGEHVCGISSEGQSTARDAREYVGKRVPDAVTLAESRDLTPRVLGDSGGGRDDDRRLDRVNLCDRGGTVVSAAIF